LHHEPVDLRLLSDECNRTFSERLQHGQLELTTEVKTPIETILADPLRLKQALFNLLGNSVKFTAAGGIIKMAAGKTADGHVEIAIADSGIGISRAYLEKVLQPFGQASNVHDRAYEGSGLGLYLVKSIVELHGGELILDSEPGRGHDSHHAASDPRRNRLRGRRRNNGFALDQTTMHFAGLSVIDFAAGMHGATIIPHDRVSRLPDLRPYKHRLFGMRP